MNQPPLAEIASDNTTVAALTSKQRAKAVLVRIQDVATRQATIGAIIVADILMAPVSLVGMVFGFIVAALAIGWRYGAAKQQALVNAHISMREAKTNSGFTLIELLTVVAVLAIAAALIIPLFR